jgi:hypothetical protein
MCLLCCGYLSFGFVYKEVKEGSTKETNTEAVFFFVFWREKAKKKDEQQQTRLYSNRSNLFQNLTGMMYFDAFNQLWRCMETILQSPPPAPKIY